MPSDEPPTAHAVSLADVGRFAATLGMDSRDVRLLRAHGSGIYLLPYEQAVIRTAQDTDENRARAKVAVEVTAWLGEKGFPVIEPLHPEPVERGGIVATVWRYLPQPHGAPRPPVAVLGHLIRDLHALPPAPLSLPAADPLRRLRRALAVDRRRGQPALSNDQHDWLVRKAATLNTRYETLTFPLGTGLIHNDAHAGNLLVDSRRPLGYVLGDWESACYGPREIDLVPDGAPDNRFGLPEEQRRQFSDAYGYDLALWPDWPVLREIRDLHALASHLRVAPIKPAAHVELQHRLRMLMTGARVPWHRIA